MITFRQIKPNLARVYVGELEIVFSYDTPVAANLPDGRRVCTNRYFSATTKRHVKAAGYADAEAIDHDELTCLINGATHPLTRNGEQP